MQKQRLINNSSQLKMFRQNNFPKHVQLTGIINKPLLLLLVGCLYYLYQWCTVKQISDNEIYLLIKYINSVLWRVAKGLTYIEDARCLKVKKKFKMSSVRDNMSYTLFRTYIISKILIDKTVSSKRTKMKCTLQILVQIMNTNLNLRFWSPSWAKRSYAASKEYFSLH